MLARCSRPRTAASTIIFSRTRRTEAKVADDLAEWPAAAAIHGGDPARREQARSGVPQRQGRRPVATDVAACGIDVENVTHVINYQCPEDEKTYLHRIGRTARAGNTGTAVTFVDWDDLHRWGMINRVLDLGIPEPMETYSSSPHLYSELNIPEGAKGRLPRGQRTREGLEAEVLEDLGETGKSGGRGPGRGGQGRGGRGERDGGGRGGRDGGRDGGRGGRDGGKGERPEGRSEAPAGEGADRPRRNRNRRRTWAAAGRPARAHRAEPASHDAIWAASCSGCALAWAGLVQLVRCSCR